MPLLAKARSFFRNLFFFTVTTVIWTRSFIPTSKC